MGHNEKMGKAGRGLVESKKELFRVFAFSRPFDQPGEWRSADGCVPPLAYGGPGKAEQTGQRLPPFTSSQTVRASR